MKEPLVYYLSRDEARAWKDLARKLLAGDQPDLDGQPESLKPALCYFLGTGLLNDGRPGPAMDWLRRGADIEPVRASGYLLDYLERNEGVLVAPEPSFDDPRPWAHFSSLPHLLSARATLVDFCAGSLSEFEAPVKMMDIGCGNGRLTVAVLKELLAAGKAAGVEEVLVLDPSTEMVRAAASSVSEAFPEARVTAVEDDLQGSSSTLAGGFDIGLCALSVHHMPYEKKAVHIGELAERVDNLIVFELGANHDTPDMNSPELVYSIYQTFGQSLEYIFSREAPAEVQRACADIFVMSETVSLLSAPRGERTEYHMMRGQWHELLGDCCEGMTCLGERTCYSDEYCELFALHYGR